MTLLSISSRSSVDRAPAMCSLSHARVMLNNSSSHFSLLSSQFTISNHLSFSLLLLIIKKNFAFLVKQNHSYPSSNFWLSHLSPALKKTSTSSLCFGENLGLHFVYLCRVWNCTFLVANATKNFALATRISPLVANGRLTTLFHATIITETINLIFSQID